MSTKTSSKRTRRTESSFNESLETEESDMDQSTDQLHGGNEEGKPETQQNVETMEESEKQSRKRESKDEPEAIEAKKPCLNKDDKQQEEDHKGENNMDAEDSINLDLGDDELLNEEVCFYVFKVNFSLPSRKTIVTNGYMMEVD